MSRATGWQPTSRNGMPIPHVIHQLWKNDIIPSRWRAAVASVRRYHKGWDYRLWTDEAMDRYLRERHPELHRTFAAFNRSIMRIDAFRYVLMQDFGGLYCDLDYEFVRPYDYGGAELLLSLESDVAFGDDVDQIANYMFASAPGYPLWTDMLANLVAEPPVSKHPLDITALTGPAFLSRIYYRDPQRYSGVRVTPKPVFSPRRVHGRRERKFYVNSGITYGFHHGWGSWRERANLWWLKRRLGKLLRLEELQRSTGVGLLGAEGNDRS